MKQLSQLLSNVSPHESRIVGDPIISSLVYDSRKTKKNCIFFALPGLHSDGHQFIEEAINAGAAVVFHTQELEHYRPEICYLRVSNTRTTLSSVSAAFWDCPSQEMTVIGVTGTDGKSTTVSLICQLLSFLGVSAGNISTVELAVGEQSEPNYMRQSTPEAPEIHALLRAMKDAKQNYAVIEATSHGLSALNSRLADVDFDVAVFTNVTTEHLEFHGSLEQYRQDKAKLFEMIGASKNRDAFGVVNQDDPYAELFIEAAGEKPVFGYSLEDKEADLFASDLQSGPKGTRFMLHTPFGKSATSITLPCLFNVENALAALCVVSELLDEDPVGLAQLLPKLVGVKGRMEMIRGDMDFHVIVDYAHSPGSFQKVLPFLRAMTTKRLIVVFGSAGERDVDKRPKQGALAEKFADVVILTDEDPREEEPTAVLKDIAAGITNLTREKSLFLIPSRKDALKKAFKMAEGGDLVAALGKGHEKTIIYAQESMEWDESEICRTLLQELGYTVRSTVNYPSPMEP